MRNDLCFLANLASHAWRKMDATDLMAFSGIEGEGWIAEYTMPNDEMVTAVMDKPLDAAGETVIELYSSEDQFNFPKMRFTIKMEKF